MKSIDIEIEIDGLNYLDHAINCAVVPIYLATKAYGVENAKIFYLYYYSYENYNLLDIEEGMFQSNFHQDIIINNLLEKKMGLHLKSIKIDNDLVDKIIHGIDLGYPVLVNTNSSKYFYSEFYKTMDHRQLLLIKGYDESRQLLITHDSEHLVPFLFWDTKYAKKLGSLYSTFYMKYDDCCEYYNSYNNIYNYQKGEIQYLCPGSVTKENSFIEAFIDISNEVQSYKNDFIVLIYHKLNIAERSIMDDSKDKGLLRFINSQYIIAKVLSNYCETENCIEKEAFKLLSDYFSNTYEVWKNYLIKGMVTRNRPSFNIGELDIYKEDIINQEKKLLECWLSIADQIRSRT